MAKQRRTSILMMVVAAALLSAGPAAANMVVGFVSVTPAGGGEFLWTYDVTLSADEETQDPATNFTTFFTLYDINGLQAGSETTQAGWTASEQNSGITPSGVAPTDNPGIANITWTLTTTSPQTTGPHDFGTFTFKSTFSATNLFINYSQQATKDNPGAGDDDTRDAGLGSVLGPSSAVPEPGTLLLLGSGLLGLGTLARRRLFGANA